MRPSSLLAPTLTALVFALPAGAEGPTFTPDAAGFKKLSAGFLKTHCLRCHGPDRTSGDFRVDKDLTADFTNDNVKDMWVEVVNVLNSHEMPPKKQPQPKEKDRNDAVDWITAQLKALESSRKDSNVVLRRMNRDEYHNTIRDLIGIDFDISMFPLDPPAGGFDNNGKALTVSPLHVELYLEAARRILDRALVSGEKPGMIRWRFQPESGDSDGNRVEYDGQRVIVNGGQNRTEGPFRVMHHDVWNRKINARDFRVPTAGEYVIRVRAAGKVPSRDQVVKSAEKGLRARFDEQMKKNPKGERYHRDAFERGLEHFRTERMYDYGPPRLKLVLNLGGQPSTVAEFDADAPLAEAKVHEFRARFNTEKAGVTLEYAYSVPSVLENFWIQGHDEFARPEAFVDWVEIEGPVYESWPPKSHRMILFDSPLRDRDENAYAREVVSRFMHRAFRRPIADDEVDSKFELFRQARAAGLPFIDAIKLPLTAVMVSPHFLYLAEPASEGRRELNEYELASRLSYFLWSSMPDEELTRLADEKKLTDPETLRREVDRLLNDPKSEAFVTNFAGQWLGLREVGSNPPAADLFPKYDRHLETSIVKESEAFFREILDNDLSVENFIHSDFVTINERLARFYGIPGVRGDHFRKVPAPESSHRGGVMTQASVLTITSNGTRTSPVKRGTWVLKNILGTDPGLPVANAGEIAPKVPGIDKATVRQRLEVHRSLTQCARCHSKIDPLGFSLENFDASGDWREQEGFGYKGRVGENDPKVDASGELPDGTKFEGVSGLQQVLMERQDLFRENLASKLFTYALGRELSIVDRDHVRDAVAHMKANGDTLRALTRFIVTSEPFRKK